MKKLLILPVVLLNFIALNSCFANEIKMPDITPSQYDKEEFIKLYNQWQIFLSNPSPKLSVSSRSEDFIDCEPYRKIIALGKPVILFLIEKMEEGRLSGWRGGQFLLWHAVRDISGVDLSKKAEDKGFISENEITERYINWWKQRNKTVEPKSEE
jgi:hypothetical protein